MLFNSLDFAVFLPVVFLLYWFVTHHNLKLQNGLVVLASYLFYGWWDWRFLSLIVFSTVVDYTLARKLGSETNAGRRKLLLYTSIAVNLGLLGFFKYYNFFLDNFVAAFAFFGASFKPDSLSVILPVGISFYTFQTLSYTIDVYKRKLEPTEDFIAFSAFVSFFPQLVAGPIERAKHLLPQFYKPRSFDYAMAINGLRQILWGLFKKVVIADNCAEVVDLIFADHASMNGSTLVLGAVMFAFQIYCDFSGYSDIAIGTARLFGFDLMQNFRYPYFSRDIAEFWRSWHISLSTWFRDYLYIPLGGSRGGLWLKIRNIFIIFIVSGFWHGANWTFIAWGALNALFFLPLMLTDTNRNNLSIAAEHGQLPTLREAGSILGTFAITTLAWIFFRADTIGQAIEYTLGIFNGSLFEMPALMPKVTLLFIVLLMVTEWFGRRDKFALERLPDRWASPIRYLGYYFLIFCILWFSDQEQSFIYFQF